MSTQATNECFQSLEDWHQLSFIAFAEHICFKAKVLHVVLSIFAFEVEVHGRLASWEEDLNMIGICIGQKHPFWAKRSFLLLHVGYNLNSWRSVIRICDRQCQLFEACAFSCDRGVLRWVQSSSICWQKHELSSRVIRSRSVWLACHIRRCSSYWDIECFLLLQIGGQIIEMMSLLFVIGWKVWIFLDCNVFFKDSIFMIMSDNPNMIPKEIHTWFRPLHLFFDECFMFSSITFFI